ncbi:MAG: hypothetical protein QOH60_2159 [Mycobacterium sp.]|jgi:hypothetical protein|nr:hypothetical protein [Mycobacterium sp.]
MLSIYLCVGLLTAVTVFAIADSYHSRDAHHGPSVATYSALSVVAGALWPILLVGLIEFACVMLIARRIRTAHRSSTRTPTVLAGR